MVDDASRNADDAGEQPSARPLRLALELVAAGYFVAPVVIRRDPRTGKKLGDYLGIRWHAESSTEPAQVRDWWAQYQPSFLVDTGRSGVFAVDLDVPPTGPSGLDVWADTIPDTDSTPMRVRTPGGGLHLYYRAPAGESLTVHKHIHGHPIDVRGDGGHVYAPGAVVLGPGSVPELRGYELVVGLVPALQLPELPASVADFLHAARTSQRKAPTAQGEVRTRSAVLEILRGQLDRISDAPAREGSGFRGIVNGAGVCFGRAIAAGMTTEAGARRRLEERVARVWGSVDSDDRRWIRHGLEDGQADPWTVVPDDYDTTVPKSIMSTLNPASVNPESDHSTSAMGSLSNGGAEVEAESVSAAVRADGADSTDAGADDQLAELEEADSWAPVDLGPFLDGTVTASQPAVGLVRSDGHRFIYPGLEHSVIGEMESGKSWFALGCVAAELRAGHRVIYVHFEEASPADTLERLRLLGVPVEILRSAFVFIGPERRISASDTDRLLAMGAPSLVVLDGVNEAMSLHGQGIREEDGAAEYRRRLVKPWTRAGAAVISLDHVVKDPDANRQGYALGSAHKGNGLNGALILLENIDPFGRGRDGASQVCVTKDRPAQLRQLGRPTKVPRKFFVGMLYVENAPGTPEGWRMRFEPPAPLDPGEDPEFAAMREESRAATKAAELEEAVLAVIVDLDAKGIDVSANKIVSLVTGKRANILDAMHRLEAAGRIKDSAAGSSGARWVPAGSHDQD